MEGVQANVHRLEVHAECTGWGGDAGQEILLMRTQLTRRA